MAVLRSLLVALLVMTLATPAMAQAQANGEGIGRGAAGHGPLRGRGGRGGRGLGLLPALLLPALAAGARAAAQSGDDGDPRPRRPRRPRPRVAVARPAAPRHVKPRAAVIRPVAARRLRLFQPPTPNRPKTSVAALHLPPAGETRFRPDEILVVFRGDADAQEIKAFARREKLDLMQTRDLNLIGRRVLRFRIAGQRPVARVLRALAREPQVAWAQPNYVFALQEDAARPAPAPVAEAPPPSYASALLRLAQAHRLATGRGVRVAVIDLQIDADHPEISGAVAGRFDALEGAEGGTKAEPQKHGTGMASAIAGHKRIDGVAPQAQILAVRAFGDGDRASGLDVLAGLDWAAAQKAQVINMSFAGPEDPLLAEMLAAAARRGIALIAAAGNDGPRSPPLYPAADPNVIAVSAVDEQENPYAMANRGAYVALAAPGVDVLVAAPRGGYGLSTGTSVACAEVSGVAALALEEHPGLDGPGLRRLLQASAKRLARDPDAGAGAGLADAEAAVERKD